MADNPLLEVVTIEEAAEMWDKHMITVRRAIDARRYPLIARKSKRVWLISVASLERRWGKPKAHLTLR